MSALAILSCQQNSHPFQERQIYLDEPTKIGRSVARVKPANNNGIFDCKVLSRNHAVLGYENGRFFLQDTKSSNGTFVNDERLCKGGEESKPREIWSGDLIQFGVNVVETNRRGEKVTHGCIIATVTLYHPDGKEAKDNSLSAPISTPGITIQSQHLYKLAQYLQEALHREKLLEKKLTTLQELVQNTQESSEGGWQALIDEDRLLSRLQLLENQLHTFSKNHSEDALRQELVSLQEEKLNYETTAKESLMKVLQEKIEAVGKLSDLERSLVRSEEECKYMREMCEGAQDELQVLAESYEEQVKEVRELKVQLQNAETKHLEEMERTEKDRVELSEKIDEMVKEEEVLKAKIESLLADNDISNKQISTMRAKLGLVKDTNEDEFENNMKSVEADMEKSRGDSDDEDNDISNKQISTMRAKLGLVKDTNEDEFENNMKSVEADMEKSRGDSDDEVITSVIIANSLDNDDKNKDQLPEDIEGKLKETQQQIEIYKNKLEESENQLQQSAARVEQLQKELEMSKLESLQYVARISTLEEKLKLSEIHMNQMVENTIDGLRQQNTESFKQVNSSNDLMKSLQDRINELESEVGQYKIPLSELTLEDVPDPDRTMDTLVQTSTDTVDSATIRPTRSHDDDSELEKLLSEAKQLLSKTEEDLRVCRVELDESQTRAKKSAEENSALKTELSDSKTLVEKKSEMVIDLQEQLQKAENTTKEVKQQILELRDQLLEEQEQSKKSVEEISSLKNELSTEKTKHEETKKNLSDTKKLLTDSQQTSKQSQNEATQLRNKLRQHTESEAELSPRHTPEKRVIPHLKHPYHAPDTPSRLPVSKRQANEFTALKEECASLRKRIQAIEAEMHIARRENSVLSQEYNKLQDSYKELEALKDELQGKESTWMSNLTDSQKKTESTKRELQKAKEEISALKQKCEDCDKEITRLNSELKKMSGNYSRIATRSKVISFCSSIPLLMLLFAVLLAIYPALESLTAGAT